VLSTIYAKFASIDYCIAEQMGNVFMADYTTVIVALWNRADHYIFVLWFPVSSSSMTALCNRGQLYFLYCRFYLLLSFILFSTSNLSRRRLDVYHTSKHGVALVRI